MSSLQIVWNVNPEIFRISGFSLRYYSLLIAVGFIIAYQIVKRIYHSERLDENRLTPLLVYIIAGTIIGARLGQTLFYEFDYYKNHPLEIIFPFRIGKDGFEWTGFMGLSSHGGAIGVAAALWLYCKKYGEKFLPLVDKLVIAIPVVAFFIRIGNLFNSEILGKPTSLPWAFIFQKVDPLPRHPSQLYEALAYLVVFLLLYKLYPLKRQKNGYLFGLFLILVFAARFLIEFTKENQVPFEQSLSLNMGQLLSIPFILTGGYLIMRKSKQDTIDKI